jgi:hypothetical protein
MRLARTTPKQLLGEEFQQWAKHNRHQVLSELAEIDDVNIRIDTAEFSGPEELVDDCRGFIGKGERLSSRRGRPAHNVDNASEMSIRYECVDPTHERLDMPVAEAIALILDDSPRACGSMA